MKSLRHRTKVACAVWLMVLGVASDSVAEDPAPASKQKAGSTFGNRPPAKVPADSNRSEEKSEEEQRAQREKLRREFPFESIAPRLAYENKRKAQLPPEVVLSARAADYLDKADEESRSTWAESLYLLHEQQTDEFVERPGFGVGRTVPPGTHYLTSELPEPPGEFDKARKPLPKSEAKKRMQLALEEAPRGWNAGRAPSVFNLAKFHNENQYNFTTDEWTGYVRDREHVAGFRPHLLDWRERLDGFSRESLKRQSLHPGLAPKESDRRYDKWLTTRLELVSLLKHDGPRVYVAERLPAMAELLEAETRELNTFETRALDRLHEGEDIAFTAKLNRIQLLGAVRTVKKCLQCHTARHGELLGAFSYDLQRDEPLIDPPAD